MVKQFEKDLVTGSKAERIVSELFDGCGLTTTPVDSSGVERSFWDLKTIIPSVWKLPMLDFTTEVKYDIYEGGSGNIAIEIENVKSHTPSGLSQTKADFWCEVLIDAIWICNTKELQRFVKDNKPFREIGCGGDDNARLLLYKTYLLLPTVFHRIDHLEIQPLRDKIRTLCWTINSESMLS